MSDVLYEVNNYEAIVEVIHLSLKEHGRAVIGTKSYYFGNGGSLGEFKQFVANDKRLEYEQLKNIDTKVSNRREVFSLRLVK